MRAAVARVSSWPTPPRRARSDVNRPKCWGGQARENERVVGDRVGETLPASNTGTNQVERVSGIRARAGQAAIGAVVAAPHIGDPFGSVSRREGRGDLTRGSMTVAELPTRRMRWAQKPTLAAEADQSARPGERRCVRTWAWVAASVPGKPRQWGLSAPVALRASHTSLTASRDTNSSPLSPKGVPDELGRSVARHTRSHGVGRPVGRQQFCTSCRGLRTVAADATDKKRRGAWVCRGQRFGLTG